MWLSGVVPNGVICVGAAHGPTADRCPILPDERVSSPLLAAEQGSGLINATLPGVGALGGGDVAGVIPLHAVGELGEDCAGLLISAGAAARSAGRVTFCGVSAMVRVTRMESSPFRPVALRTAALMLIMCLPPDHADRVPVFVPVDVEEHGRAFSGRELFDGLLRYHDAVWNRAER
jgi:hypothetical protein